MKFIIFISIFFTFQVHAIELEACFESAKFYGDGTGRDKIADDCFEVLKSNGAQTVTSSKDDIQIVGLQNLIMIKNFSSNKITAIAGRYTELDEVKELSFDEVFNELYVLGVNGEIKVYMTNLPGNVAPIRYFRHPEDAKISKFTVDYLNGKVHLYSEQDKEIVLIDREANLMQPKHKQKQNILQRHPASNVADLKFDRKSGKVILKSR